MEREGGGGGGGRGAGKISFVSSYLRNIRILYLFLMRLSASASDVFLCRKTKTI